MGDAEGSEIRGVEEGFVAPVTLAWIVIMGSSFATRTLWLEMSIMPRSSVSDSE